MDAATMIDLIPTLGFPIVCVIVLAFFIFWFVKQNQESYQKNMKTIQEENQVRENKLYDEIAKCREVNSKAVEAISTSVDKLSRIQDDINDIKTNVEVLKAKID